jgi:folate-binding Fe-S cluster repair protein YgfZ
MSDEDIKAKIYPNPANNNVTVEIDNLEKEKTVQFSLYDISGRLLIHNSFVEIKKTIILDNISNGLYFYSIEINGFIVKQDKLIILK